MKASVRQFLLRALCIALISAALVALSYGIAVWTHPEMVSVPVLPENAESVLSEASFRAVNASIDDGLAFRTKRADAQLYITGIARPVRTLCVQTREVFPSDVVCQLFYALPGEALSENRSVKLITGIASDQIVFALPGTAAYETFRLDIDRGYAIRDLLVSADTAEAQTVRYDDARRDGKISTPTGQLALGFGLLFLAGIAVSGKSRKREKK